MKKSANRTRQGPSPVVSIVVYASVAGLSMTMNISGLNGKIVDVLRRGVWQLYTVTQAENKGTAPKPSEQSKAESAPYVWQAI